MAMAGQNETVLCEIANSPQIGGSVVDGSGCVCYSSLQWCHNERHGVKDPRHWPLCGEFPHKRPVTRKVLPFDDVIMSKQQPQGRSAIVSSNEIHPGSEKNDSNSEILITILSATVLFSQYPSYTYLFWSLDRVHIISLSINIALRFPSLPCMLIFFEWQQSVTPKNVFMKIYFENWQITLTKLLSWLSSKWPQISVLFQECLNWRIDGQI